MPRTMLGAKVHKMLGALRHERRALGALRAEHGLRRAVAERGQETLGLAGLPGTIAALEARLDEQTARLAAADAGAYGHLEAHQQWLEHLAERVAFHDAEALRHEAGRTEREWVAARTARTNDIAATTAWVEALPPSPTLVSVVMPCHGRTHLLREAIDSVFAQSHQNFELIVVDDCGGPETAELMASIQDPRVKSVRRDRDPGAAKARNAGLDVATGEYVAYLDDDNLIGRSWLRAVIWALESHPEADLVYGALVTDMDWRSDGLPWLMLEPWNRRLLPFHNPIDQNTMAHRTGLPEARFAEDNRSAGDWELTIRLTRDKDPVRVPVVAAAYRTKVDGRASDEGRTRLDWARLQQKFLRSHPLRVLGLRATDDLDHCWPLPVVQELERTGAETAWCRLDGVARTGDEDEFSDLDRAIDEFRPDVVIVPEGSVAARRLEQLQVPFVILAGPGDRPEEIPLPVGSFYVGSWSAAAPFGTPGQGEALRAELLRQLDRVRSRRSGFPDPGLVPRDAEPATTAAKPQQRSAG